MTLEDYLGSLSPSLALQLKGHIRATWVPRYGGDDDGPVSKVGGAPWLPTGSAHPRCQGCDQHLQLFLQLRGDEVRRAAPELPAGSLLQLFYCVNAEGPCDVETSAWAPFNESTVARLLPLDVDGVPGEQPSQLAGKRILGFEQRRELPHPEDAWGLLTEVPNELFEHNLAGDKLGGWPHWIQGAEYPSCPKCSKRMHMLYQLDSHDGLDWMFGDSGIGHLSYCPRHPEVLAFGWACC